MPPDHEIAKILSGDKFLPPEEAVHELDGLSLRDTKTPVHFRSRRGLPCVVQNPTLGIRPARARIDWPLIVSMRGLECAQNVLPGAAAGIEPASSQKLFKSCLIKRPSLALFVRPKTAAAIGSFLPAKAQPAQVFKHRFGKSHLCPNGVDIIAAQDQNTPSIPRPLLGRPEGASVADM